MKFCKHVCFIVPSKLKKIASRVGNGLSDMPNLALLLNAENFLICRVYSSLFSLICKDPSKYWKYDAIGLFFPQTHFFVF
jgi:hypothetical protein